MIDRQIVAREYASMNDGQLQKFAEEESPLLTTESLGLLTAEFQKRGLKFPVKVTGMNQFFEDQPGVGPQYPIPMWQYAFDQKEYGINDNAILEGLIERGMDEADALSLLSKLKNASIEKIKIAEQEKLTAGLLFMSGLAMSFLPFSISANRLIYIVSWSLMIFGAIRFLKGMYNKSRFQKILKNSGDE